MAEIKMTEIERHDTDILILGSGGAGLFAALHAQKAAPDLKITLAVKGLIGKCGCTRMVQGGYNVALGGGDTVERHFMDTVIGGKWLPDQDMAWRLCSLAVERITELENEVGCFFDRNADGSLHQKAFAGQTADRTVHKGDLTGIEIISRLMEQVLRRPVEKLQEHRAIAFIPASGGDGLAGVLFIDMRTGKFRFVRAKTVLMSTGGGPTMYRYHTPSGDKTMDGLAMALRRACILTWGAIAALVAGTCFCNPFHAFRAFCKESNIRPIDAPSPRKYSMTARERSKAKSISPLRAVAL